QRRRARCGFKPGRRAKVLEQPVSAAGQIKARVMPQPDANSLEALHDGPHSAWGEPERDGAVRAGEDLIIGVDGFEGPLDVLLALARTQKVDLAQISVLALAEQYLAFVERAQALRLELAADYLVMAAWLAYLKSRLLLPRSEAADEQPSGEELVAQKEQAEFIKQGFEEFSSTLKGKELIILEKRLISEEKATLQELSDELGISRERVRQIENRIKERLKSFFHERLQYIGGELDL
ncbi:MAG: segregation/condensation protein A, partial [Bdellovibrionales bacterium]|nr:segregation/condensation protein A [Bdellovibrionales bacterium]